MASQILPNTSRPCAKRITSALFALGLAFPGLVSADDIVFPPGPLTGVEPLFSAGNSLFPTSSLSGNTVTVNSGNIGGYVYGGADATTKDVYNNKVTVNTPGSIGNRVNGGAAASGAAYNNTVTVTNGKIGADFNYDAYVSGGFTRNDGQVYGNTVTINGSTVVINGYANGGESYQGDVYNNNLIISDGTISAAAYGGYTGTNGGSGQAYGNKMTVTGGRIGSSVAGGRSEAGGDVYGNELLIEGGTFNGDNVYGGRSSGGRALNNTVTISGGTFNGQASQAVYGGKGDDSSKSGGEASGNRVSITGGLNITNVYGGFSVGSLVKTNSVNISGTANGAVTGGFSSGTGEVSGNSVTVSGRVGQGVYGGFSSGTGEVSGNSITVSGQVGGAVTGGFSSGIGEVSGNSLNILGQVDQSVYGGYSSGTGQVSGNSLKISGRIGQGLYGGFSNGAGDVTDNTIDFSGTLGAAYLIGGAATAGQATNNSLTIGQSAQIDNGARLFGGYLTKGGNYDVFSGNSLVVDIRPALTLAQLDNFENYELTLPAGFGVNDTLITVTDGPTHLNSQTDNGRTAKFTLHMPSGLPLKKVGDYFTVINDTAMYGGGQYKVTGSGQMGLGVHYEYALENQSSIAPAEALIATITRAAADPDTRALMDVGLGPALFLTQGADFAVNRGLEAAIGTRLLNRAEDCGTGDWSKRLFGLVGFSSSRQDTGGQVNADGLNMMVGLSLGNNSCTLPLTLALFLEGGKGDYDSDAHVKGGRDINGRGDLSYFGGGLMGKAEQLAGNLYLEGSFRFGRSESEYQSDNFDVPQNLGGVLPKFDFKSNYFGAHVGLGYVFEVNESLQLDTSVKYLWQRLEGDNATILGDRFHFDDIDSHRIQVGGRLSWNVPYDRAAPYVGAWYEYEFDGKAGGRIHGLRMPGTDLKGSTGLLEAGVRVPTGAGGSLLDIGLNGSFGQRESLGGHAALRWEF